MTSLLGESSLFCRISDIKKEGTSNENHIVHSLYSTPPSSMESSGSQRGDEETTKITINLFNAHGSNSTYSASSPPPSNNSTDEPHSEDNSTTISDLLGTNSGNPDGEMQDNKASENDINSFISKIHQQIVLQQQMIHPDGQQDGSESKPIVMTAYSPWMRNAGRKKSHPVWEFFRDLKDKNGLEGGGGVVCLYCDWRCDDRSPNNLRTHLKKYHSDDGIFTKFSEKLAQNNKSAPENRLKELDCDPLLEEVRVVERRVCVSGGRGRGREGPVIGPEEREKRGRKKARRKRSFAGLDEAPPPPLLLLLAKKESWKNTRGREKGRKGGETD
ncbi:hypothetical protein WR25_17987 [Diploscapter pachys]|uniref:BED-type domain-containing protein n=1 Tax=Diploscapter pachys TaxID=2018661 RepID=A0A2A2JG41_9BILA|nr:hypothetical protein WR25_17987 [Diploscapter pachys]